MRLRKSWTVVLILAALAAAAPTEAGSSSGVPERGFAFVWGRNDFHQLGPQGPNTVPSGLVGLSGIVSADGALNHSVAALRDGSAWAWGYRSCGKLGDGTTAGEAQLPSRVSGLTSVIQIEAGRDHTVALTSTGEVWAWGCSSYGQLGNGVISGSEGTPFITPVKVHELSDVVQISAFNNHNVALMADGTVWAWGSNELGQLGDGTYTDRGVPVRVTGLTGRFVQVSAGGDHSLARRADGSVWAWGLDEEGQLGDDSIGGAQAVPTRVKYMGPAKAIAAGRGHSIAISQDGAVRTWGSNDSRQLGLPDSTLQRARPATVMGISAVQVIAGYDYSSALRSDGRVASWGSDYYGQLGGASCGDVVCSKPVIAEGLSNVMSIDSGWWHSFAIIDCTISGTSSGEQLVGTAANDVICGFGGNDEILAGEGNDVVVGGRGNDTLRYSGGSNVLSGGLGVDRLSYEFAPSWVWAVLRGPEVVDATTEVSRPDGSDLGWPDIENLSGSAYDDTLWGSSGANRLGGRQGQDVLKGFEGDDYLDGGAGSDTCDGGSGANTLINC